MPPDARLQQRIRTMRRMPPECTYAWGGLQTNPRGHTSQTETYRNADVVSHVLLHSLIHIVLYRGVAKHYCSFGIKVVFCPKKVIYFLLARVSISSSQDFSCHHTHRVPIKKRCNTAVELQRGLPGQMQLKSTCGKLSSNQGSTRKAETVTATAKVRSSSKDCAKGVADLFIWDGSIRTRAQIQEQTDVNLCLNCLWQVPAGMMQPMAAATPKMSPGWQLPNRCNRLSDQEETLVNRCNISHRCS
eukprot:5777928-Amphidinium_carterae.2